jgi:hypothetical protein
MQTPKQFDSRDQLLMVMSCIISGAIALLLIRTMPPVEASLISSLMLSVLFFACTRISQHMLWWATVGAIAGIIVGIGAVLSESLAEAGTTLDLKVRGLIVLFQTTAGFISGLLLGKTRPNSQIPTPKELLSKLSGLTASVFAVVVTLEFIIHGLEEARTLSSRLSATTTIMITLIIIPGFFGYFLSNHRSSRNIR